jgi:hypothetical protein
VRASPRDLRAADEARHRAVEHIVRLQSGPEWPGDTKIITGLLNLSMLLVVQLAHERDPEAEDLLEKARDILRDLSPKLPE